MNTTTKYSAEPFTARQSERQILKSKVETLEENLKAKDLELEKKNQDIKTSEKAIEILQNQLETIKAEKDEYTKDLEERIELHGYKHTELNEKIQLLNNKIQEMQISKPESQFECNHENEIKFLKEANAKLEMQVKMCLPDLADVFKPTADDLENTLKGLQPLLNEVRELKKATGLLREDSKMTYYQTNHTPTALQKTLNDYDKIFIELCPKYLVLYPKIVEELKALKKTINKGTHEEISPKNCNAFSAKNKVPLKTMSENHNNFELLLTECNSTYFDQEKLIQTMGENFDNAVWFLNKIDINLGTLKSESIWTKIDIFSEYKQKTRISPTSPNFKPITMDVKKNETSELALDQV